MYIKHAIIKWLKSYYKILKEKMYQNTYSREAILKIQKTAYSFIYKKKDGPLCDQGHESKQV